MCVAGLCLIRSVTIRAMPAVPSETDFLVIGAGVAGLRAAIELAYFGGRTYRQVAQELGIPEGTAKSRMRLGLGRIAQALEAQGVDLAWT